MGSDWLAWLRKTAPEEAHEERVERLIGALRNPDRLARRRADWLLARALEDVSAYEPDFLMALLSALAREPNAEPLEFVPR